jgi:hypothetical protein
MGAYNIVNPAALVGGQPEDISVVLANFNAIAAVINGSIDNSNINVAAGIAASKLAGFPSDSTKVLLGNGTWGSFATGAGPPNTGLPGSPADGQQVLYTDNATTPTFLWVLQWNTAAAKWFCVGQAGALEGTTTLTIPRAGTYMVEIGALGLNAGPSSTYSVYALSLVAGGITLQAMAGQGGGQNNPDYSSAYDRGRMVGLTASQVLTVVDSSSNSSGAITATRRYVRAEPVWVT